MNLNVFRANWNVEDLETSPSAVMMLVDELSNGCHYVASKECSDLCC